MGMKNILTIAVILLLSLMPAACSGVDAITNSTPGSVSTTLVITVPLVTTLTTSVSTTAIFTQTTTATQTQIVSTTVSKPPASTDTEYDAGSADIVLKGSAISASGTGATVSGSTITITDGGIYNVSGTLSDGQIIVNAPDDAKVALTFNGVNITCSTSAPVYVKNADKVTITLTAGTNNSVTDGTSYMLDDLVAEEPSAAIFSKSDLTINGSGTLTVKASYNHGIQSKDDLKITGGTLNITSKVDALKGRDSVTVRDADITVTSGGDGIQSNNDEDAAKGFVVIESGTLNINSAEDGIQAETALTVTSGVITIKSGGGSTTMKNDNISSKGLKAGVELIIDGGAINIDSSDDALHSNDSITINGGDITLATSDDAVHADISITVNGGDITITKCYEGFESKTVTMNSGNVHLVSTDDGINGVSTGTVAQPGNPFGGASNAAFYIKGGTLFVDAGGDGIDVNGSIEMAGGTVIVNGPTRSDNSALDFKSFKITGGLLVAVGSAGMAQAPGNTSTQYSLMVNFTSTLAAGTLICIQDATGNVIATFKPTKTYQSAVVSSPAITRGATLSVYTGGNASGTMVDGLYSEGIYTAGTKAFSVQISAITTTAGSVGMGPGGRRP
jgi:hypothetical protein